MADKSAKACAQQCSQTLVLAFAGSKGQGRSQYQALSNELVTARKDLPDETCERIKQALLALDPKKVDAEPFLDRLYGVRGYVAAEMSDFADVANIAARYGFIRNSESFARSSPGPGQQDGEESKR